MKFMMQYTDIMILLMKGSADVYINDDYQMHLQEFDNAVISAEECRDLKSNDEVVHIVIK